MMNFASAIVMASPMQPVRIVDGSVAPVEPVWSGWVWVGTAVWCAAMCVVGWIAVLRHLNRKGGAARVVKRAAKWRGLEPDEMKMLEAMAEVDVKANVKGNAKEQVKGDARQQRVLAMLLLPRIAAEGLDRAWDQTGDRTEGVQRAGLIRLRGKLGVLDAERSGRLREDHAEGDEVRSRATIVPASYPSIGDGGAT
jgi:hypothetical protein